MNLSDKVYQKAKTASSADELMRFAAEEGMSLGKDEAEKYFSFLHSSGKLSDEEAEAITGGKGSDDGPKPKYRIGQSVSFQNMEGYIESYYYSDFQQAFYYMVLMENGEKYKFPLESSACAAKVI